MKLALKLHLLLLNTQIEFFQTYLSNNVLYDFFSTLPSIDISVVRLTKKILSIKILYAFSNYVRNMRKTVLLVININVYFNCS